jgi:hypothetical protein
MQSALINRKWHKADFSKNEGDTWQSSVLHCIAVFLKNKTKGCGASESILGSLGRRWLEYRHSAGIDDSP